MKDFQNVIITSNDLRFETIDQISESGVVSIDIETTGLDWKYDQLATVQLHTENLSIIFKDRGTVPSKLLGLFENSNIKKIFHHAMFDIRFITNVWGVRFENVVCTKVASKLLNKHETNHSLKHLLSKYLNINIEKDMYNSDWFNNNLSEDQIRYALNDVIHLKDLHEELQSEIQRTGLYEVATACFDFIPYKAWLQVNDFEGVFEH